MVIMNIELQPLNPNPEPLPGPQIIVEEESAQNPAPGGVPAGGGGAAGAVQEVDTSKPGFHIHTEGLAPGSVATGFNLTVEDTLKQQFSIGDTAQMSLHKIRESLNGQVEIKNSATGEVEREGVKEIEIETTRCPDVTTYTDAKSGTEYFAVNINYKISWKDSDGTEHSISFTKPIYPRSTDFEKAMNASDKFAETMTASFEAGNKTAYISNFIWGNTEAEKNAFLNAKSFVFTPSRAGTATAIQYRNANDELVTFATYTPNKKHYTITKNGLQKLSKAAAADDAQKARALELTLEERNKMIQSVRNHNTLQKPENQKEKDLRLTKLQEEIESDMEKFKELSQGGPIFIGSDIGGVKKFDYSPAFEQYQADPLKLSGSDDAKKALESIRSQLREMLMLKATIEGKINEYKALKNLNNADADPNLKVEQQKYDNKLFSLNKTINPLFNIPTPSNPLSTHNAAELKQACVNKGSPGRIADEIAEAFINDNKNKCQELAMSAGLKIQIYDQKTGEPTNIVFNKTGATEISLWQNEAGYLTATPPPPPT